MFQILCDAYVQEGIEYDLRVGGLLLVVIGIPVLAVIGLVLLVKAIIRENEKKKSKKDSSKEGGKQ